MRTLRSRIGIAALLLAFALSGCSGDPSSTEQTSVPTPSDGGASATASASPGPTETPGPTPTPSPTPSPTPIAIPDDCRAILSDDVLAQLDGVPLNDPAMGETGTFTPDEGTRCEKTWQNTSYPVTDGRTLFWRDGVLIDTSYSNLAPSGYTSSIVVHLFG